MEQSIKILIVVVLIAVISLVTVLVVVWSTPDISQELPKNTLCLPDIDDSAKSNCGLTEDILNRYLTRTVESAYTAKKAEESQNYNEEYLTQRKHYQLTHGWDTRPAAKVTGTDQLEFKEGDNNAEMTPIRNWKHGKSFRDVGGFLGHGIQYRNGRLVVFVTGIYFVYSFVDFYEDCKPETGKPNIEDVSKPLRHAIYTFNIAHNKHKELMSSVQHHKISTNGHFNSYGSYVSTLLQMRAGDEISVRVSNISSLKYTRENYFGITLIE